VQSEIFGRATFGCFCEPEEGSMKRSWKSITVEILVWAAVAVLTAIILINFADKVLPSNY
jgi:hypothetical protein